MPDAAVDDMELMAIPFNVKPKSRFKHKAAATTNTKKILVTQ